MSIISKFFGSKNDRELKKLKPLVSHIASFAEGLEAKSDEELKAMTPMFREKLDNGAVLDDLLPEVFALTREAADVSGIPYVMDSDKEEVDRILG
jgi:preprotein translocase subunit SecA